MTFTAMVLYSIATILLLAAMIFAVRMLLEAGDRRPWVMLLAALSALFAFRILAFYITQDTRQQLGPWLLVLVSGLLLASLFYFRAVSNAERASKRLAERRTAERDEIESRYQVLAEMCPEAMYVSVEGRICYVNAAAVRFFGARKREDLLGRSPASLAAPDSRDRVLARSKRLKEIGQTLAIEPEECQRLDGSIVPVEAAAAVVPWQGAPGTLVILRDVSERKKVEEERTQLLASERVARSTAEHASRMKDEFLATLSHELRTPLTAIVGWSQILLRGRASAEEIIHGHEAIDRNARSLTRLVEDLLDMSSILSGKLRLDMHLLNPLSIVEAAIETINPTAQAKRVRLEKELDPSAGQVRGDANRLQQIVWNLLTNAVKFTPEGGTVSVALEQSDSNIRIRVADTGQGIAADFLPFVFDRFRQADASIRRRHSGLGIGLAIVKQLVELHGGEVFVQSTGEGRGATFVVTLPAVVAQDSKLPRTDGDNTEPSRSAGNGHSVDLSGLKILVVDDEPDTCRLIKWILGECHADVVIATSAAEALPLIKTAPPDVLISDLGMPNVDGYEFLKQIRSLDSARGGRVPAIALTAFASHEDEMRTRAAGFSVHISKPIAPETLTATVASLSGRVGQSSGAV